MEKLITAHIALADVIATIDRQLAWENGCALSEVLGLIDRQRAWETADRSLAHRLAFWGRAEAPAAAVEAPEADDLAAVNAQLMGATWEAA